MQYPNTYHIQTCQCYYGHTIKLTYVTESTHVDNKKKTYRSQGLQHFYFFFTIFTDKSEGCPQMG